MIFYRYRINYGNGQVSDGNASLADCQRVLASLKTQRWYPNGIVKPKGSEWIEVQQDHEIDKNRWTRFHEERIDGRPYGIKVQS